MNIESAFDASSDDDADWNPETDHGGLVFPKQTCEHVRNIHLVEPSRILLKNECIDCESTKEKWFCLSCGQVRCSRYVNNHGEEHWLFTLLTDENNNVGHCLTLSLEDLSVWCYPCKSYIRNTCLNSLIDHIESLKFNQNSIGTKLVRSSSILARKKVQSTMIAIQDHSLLENLESTDLLSHCYTIKLRSAAIDELVALHSSDYVNRLVLAEKTHTTAVLSDYGLVLNENSLTQARISTGTTIDVTRHVVQSKTSNGLVLVTSPGNEAERHHGTGTSIYNNIAVAINQFLRIKRKPDRRKSSLALITSNNHIHREGASPIEDAICHMIHVLTPALLTPQQNTDESTSDSNQSTQKHCIDRVMIVDFTSKYGTGLQSIYDESDQVFYISIHPETSSNAQYCGRNEGLGFTMNIPLTFFNSIEDQNIKSIVTELILPLIAEFRPELIFLAFDFQIPNLSADCYAWITDQLNRSIDRKLIVILDGDLSVIASKTSFIEKTLRALLGEISFDKSQFEANTCDTNFHTRKTIDQVKSVHRQYWTCFQ